MDPHPKLQVIPGRVSTENPLMEAVLLRQKRQQAIQSALVAIMVVAMLCVCLWLIVIYLGGKEEPQVVVYVPPPTQEDPKRDVPDMNRATKPKPASGGSASAKVIASTAPAPMSVPIPEVSNPTMPWGIDDDLNAGFGDGDGDGDGGGGSSFFGIARPGKRVVYVVDFSLSMTSDAAGGGSRIAALKKELIRSIEKLDSRMQFTVIFFSHMAWSIDAPGENPADSGWNGLGPVPPVVYWPATDAKKKEFIAKLQAMNPDGNTQWYPPLKMAFRMQPPPQTVYLLSDGEPRDFDQVINDMNDYNPHKIPIDTIAFELPGTPARYMMEVAQATGGQFSMVYKGKLIRGSAAKDLTSSKYDSEVVK